VDLEHRVKVLEQELEILKNQVQATLLDIQEQLLSSYHPALRADHVNALDGLAEVARPGAERQPDRDSKEDTLIMSRPNVKTISAHDLAREPGLTPAQHASKEPVVQRVSTREWQDEPPEADLYPVEAEEFDTLQEPGEQEPPPVESADYEEEPNYQPAPPPLPSPPPPAQAPQSSLMARLSTASAVTQGESEIDWGTFTTLADWVSDNLEKMGASRMRRMVDAVARQVSVSPELKDALVQMIDLYEQDSALEEVRLYETAKAVSRGLSDVQAPTPSYESPSFEGSPSEGPSFEGYEDESWYDELSEEPEPAWKRSLIQRLISGLENLDNSQEDDRG
jgi:hypothetical protein